ncbi:5' nucleotidase, NT5C type [Arthrobacter sp. MDT2-16]
MAFVNGTTPTMALDQDGNMFDWSTRFADILLDLDPNFPVVEEGLRTHFDYFWVDGADRNTIMAALNHPRLYDDLTPLPGAIEAAREMLSMGMDVFVVSTPTWTNPGCVQGKLKDLAKHLGEGWDKRLILTHDKTVVRADLLIDDKPEITGAHTPSWVHVMRDQDYNRYIDTPHRLTDWANWKDVVMPLLEGAEVPA